VFTFCTTPVMGRFTLFRGDLNFFIVSSVTKFLWGQLSSSARHVYHVRPLPNTFITAAANSTSYPPLFTRSVHSNADDIALIVAFPVFTSISWATLVPVDLLSRSLVCVLISFLFRCSSVLSDLLH